MRTKRDKIFDNTFNEQEFDSSQKVNFSLDPRWSDDRDEEDKIQEQIIREMIHSLISDSKFKNFNHSEEEEPNLQNKFKKIEVNEIWQFIMEKMSNRFSIVDLFSETCGYFDIHPSKFYSMLSSKFKEDLIEEIDGRTNILKIKNINRLF